MEEDVDGVYYLLDDSRVVVYVGKAFRKDGGIKDRLLEHVRLNEWPDVSYFSFQICLNENEAERVEKSEIKRYQPKHNYQGK
ncbi:MAG: hypothetical protein K0U66_00175 [Gammaproteobacteria bacterium]|nr:hypothetical protein [Gammaproteobacteria bacterium]